MLMFFFKLGMFRFVYKQGQFAFKFNVLCCAYYDLYYIY